MALHISISNVKQLDDHAWAAELEPKYVRSMALADVPMGDVSMVQLSGSIQQPSGDVIQFLPDQAKVITVGRTSKTYFIRATSLAGLGTQNDKAHESEDQEGPRSAGDHEYYEALAEQPKYVQTLGEAFLNEVRRHFKGTLKPSKSGRFIERPDNFWTVKLQPRDKSLAITVRGYPRDFRVPDAIDLKADRTGYSRFKVERMEDIPGAVSIIQQADRSG